MQAAFLGAPNTEMDSTLSSTQAQQAPAQASTPAWQQAAATEEDFELYTSDDFRMWCMKVIPCTKRFVHDWSICPFAHAGEKAVRRDPRMHEYTGIACPDMKKTSSCLRGENCPYAHNVFEYWLHPTRYRTQLCNDGPSCKRSICFFAHCLDDLRTPAVKPYVSPETLARSSLAAIQQNPHPLGQQLAGLMRPGAAAARGSGRGPAGAAAPQPFPGAGPFMPGTPPSHQSMASHGPPVHPQHTQQAGRGQAPGRGGPLPALPQQRQPQQRPTAAYRWQLHEIVGNGVGLAPTPHTSPRHIAPGQCGWPVGPASTGMPALALGPMSVLSWAPESLMPVGTPHGQAQAAAFSPAAWGGDSIAEPSPRGIPYATAPRPLAMPALGAALAGGQAGMGGPAAGAVAEGAALPLAGSFAGRPLQPASAGMPEGEGSVSLPESLPPGIPASEGAPSSDGDIPDEPAEPSQGAGAPSGPAAEDLAHSLANMKIARTQQQLAAASGTNHEVVISTLHEILRDAAAQHASQRPGPGP